MNCHIVEHIRSMMTNAHFIDYFVITFADLSAVLIAGWVGKAWIRRTINTIRWQRSGNLFWLPYDLMKTLMQINRGNVKGVNPSIRNAVRHATALGIDSAILSSLNALERDTAGKQTLTAAESDELRSKLYEIISQVGKLAESNQDDFVRLGNHACNLVSSVVLIQQKRADEGRTLPPRLLENLGILTE